jgi:hypothetical protein
MEIGKLLLLIVAGVIAGFVNTLAGGGSLLTIPALIFLGIPSTVANATNRVAVLLQSLVGAERFRQKGELKLRDAGQAALPGFFGAILGALIASNLSEALFDTVLGLVLILVLVTMFIRKPTGSGPAAAWTRSPLVRVPVFFLIGVYAGFIQAGVGFLLISGITILLGLDLVKTNAIKLAVVVLYTLISLVIFAIYGMVLWHYGLLLALGSMAGAWIGVNFAVHRGARAVRWVIVAAVALSSLRLFGLM